MHFAMTFYNLGNLGHLVKKKQMFELPAKISTAAISFAIFKRSL